MKAVVLHEYGGPENLKFEDNIPEPQISGDTVLIAAAAASVNPIDWKIRSGMRQKDFPVSFPAILGRDVSGVVRAVGANVKHFKPGDRVLALSNATYAELVAVADSDVTHLPDGVDLADAAAIPLIALTGDQLVRHATNVQKGQVVLVTGALGIGLPKEASNQVSGIINFVRNVGGSIFIASTGAIVTNRSLFR